jgi:AcrR family transcriptional regulator
MTQVKEQAAVKKDARQRILEAATDSFQTLGYARTTTQMIADKAGVAEVTIFRNFRDKKKLFQEVVGQIGGGPGIEKIEGRLTYDLETDLRLISQHVLTFFLQQQDAIRMLMFESIHFPEMREALAQNPRAAIGLLESYFQKQMQAGKLQKRNLQAAAQAFISMLFGYAVAVEPIKELLVSEISTQAMSEEFVHLFLNGMRASQEGKE